MTTNQPPNGTLGKSRRRWYQFRLRTLLVIMLLVCVGSGWLGLKLQRAMQQRRVVLAFQKMGAEIIHVDERGPLEILLARVVGGEILMECVGVLLCDNQQITDTNLATIQDITTLYWLDLSRTAITDAGLVHLEGLTELLALNLKGTNVTDAGLEHLKGLTQLEELDLTGTQVTDAGVKVLLGLTNLRTLYLNGTGVTKASEWQLQMASPRLFINPK